MINYYLFQIPKHYLTFKQVKIMQEKKEKLAYWQLRPNLNIGKNRQILVI